MPTRSRTTATAATAPRKPAAQKHPAKAAGTPAGKARSKPKQPAARTGTQTGRKKQTSASARRQARTGTAATPKAAPRGRTGRAPKPKALEVLYSGRVFRSRLEARWAVFLDLLGINWDYEPCHYEVGPDLWYLPDFYLPDHRLWLEVKGAPYMDTASMAKVLGAVAGPNRIPLREHPYTASDRLLLGGPFRPVRDGRRPVHTLVTPAGPVAAHVSYAAFHTLTDGGSAIAPIADPWDTVAATGTKAARRPSPARLAMLLEPEPVLDTGFTDGPVQRAYRAAYRLAFDDATRRVMDNADHDLALILAHRRSGRPLGLAA